MVLRRANFYPLHQLRSELDRQFTGLMDNLSQVAPRVLPGRAFPVMNVWEQGDHLFAEAELPGVLSENLDISVVGNELTIRGERHDIPQPTASYHFHERGVGAFERVIRLPVEIDATRVEAKLRDGLLLITLPKHETAKPHKVQINVGSS